MKRFLAEFYVLLIVPLVIGAALVAYITAQLVLLFNPVVVFVFMALIIVLGFLYVILNDEIKTDYYRYREGV